MKCKGIAESCITVLNCTAQSPGYFAPICQTVQNTGVSTSPSGVIKKFYDIQKNRSEREEEACQFIKIQKDKQKNIEHKSLIVLNDMKK